MKRITANGFCRAWAIAGLVAALTTVVSPALANEVPTGKNQDGAEILDQGGVIEDKGDPIQQPAPNYPADDKVLQQGAQKEQGEGAEDIQRSDQDEALTGDYDYDDQAGTLAWPDDYWYWPYPLSPYYQGS